MRFLIGIITGTILTLFIATAVDAPTTPVLEKSRQSLENIWDRLIDTTSDTLFPATEPVVVSAAETREAEEHVDPQLAEPALELAAPAEEPPAPPPRLQREPIPDPLLPPPMEATEMLAALRESPAAERESAAVWTPFHSQMSAEGFAARLTRQLDHDFQVVRQGAGTYQVVFQTDTTDERELLLAQIAEITGL